MLKKEMVKELVEKVKITRCTVQRVYGVSFGVGYDLNVLVEFKNGKRKHLDAHATRASWDSPGHLRPNNPEYKYTGSNDVYQEQVIYHWEKKHGFKWYLERLKKLELQYIYNQIV